MTEERKKEISHLIQKKKLEEELRPHAILNLRRLATKVVGEIGIPTEEALEYVQDTVREIA